MLDHLIFKAIVGSQSFGTATPESDIDYNGVYMQPKDDILSFNYEEQFKVSKDEYYYEVRRFLELLCQAKPNALELLFAPLDCIVYKDPVFDLILEKRNLFITQKCFESFGNYALAQISKAKGLDKKMNWEKSRTEKKSPLDFAYVTNQGKTQPLNKWLEKNNMKQEFCGLVHLNNFKGCFALYYDHQGSSGSSKILGFRGVVKENGDELRTSSIPKEMSPLTTVFYNKDGYSQHCKDFQSYKQWQEERNEQRYVDNAGHGQKYDGKNLMHCTRLLDTAIEIATTGTINVRRPDVDYLLSIKRGEVDLADIMSNAESKIAGLETLFKNSNLPKSIDKKIVNDLLIDVRHFNDKVR